MKILNVLKFSLKLLVCVFLLSNCSPKGGPVTTEETTKAITIIELTVSADKDANVLYAESISVALTSNDETAKIYFSIDESNPPLEDDQFLYQSPITIFKNTSLLFMAISGDQNTDVTQLDYKIDLVDPKIAFTNTGSTLTKENITLGIQAIDSEDLKEIRYTFNDQITDISGNGLLYEGELLLSAAVNEEKTYHIRAVGIDESGRQSEVLEETYVIDKKKLSIGFDPDENIFRQGPLVKVTSAGAAQMFFVRGIGEAADPTTDSTVFQNEGTLQVSQDNTVIKVLAIDAAGNETIVSKTYRIDETAPQQLQASTDISQAHRDASGKLFFNQPFNVTLSTSNSSDKIYFTLTQGLTGIDPQKRDQDLYKDAILINIANGQEAHFTLKIKAFDDIGNSTSVQTITYFLDRKVPQLIMNPGSGTYSIDLSVKLGSNEPSTLLFSSSGLDPKAGTNHTTSIVLDALPFEHSITKSSPGLNTIKARVVDLAGNASAIDSREYLIDTDAPDLVISPQKRLHNLDIENIKLESKASDLKTIHYCMVQGQGSCTPSTQIANGGTLPAITFEGITKVIATAKDNLGIAFSITHEYEIDRTASVVAFSPENEVFGGNEASGIEVTIHALKADGKADQATIFYTTNGSEPTTLSGAQNVQSGIAPLKLQVSDDITLKAIALDQAGNVSQPAKSKRIKFDRAQRHAVINPANDGTHSIRSSFSIVCHKGGSANADAKTYYAIDRKAQQTSSDEFKGSIDNQKLPHNKNFTLHALCIDQFSSVTNSRVFNIDTIAPELTISPTPTSVNGSTYLGKATVVLGITNRQSGDQIFVTQNSGAEFLVTETLVLTVNTTLIVRYKDGFGNQLTKTVSYTIFQDRDEDGLADNNDSCPDDKNLGQDSDGDGVDDICDNCLHLVNSITVAGVNASRNGPDLDRDGVGDHCDSCKAAANGPDAGSFNQLMNRVYGPDNQGQMVIKKYNDGRCDDRTQLALTGFCGAACETDYCNDTTLSKGDRLSDDYDSDGIRNICDYIKVDGKVIMTDKDNDKDGVQDMFCTAKDDPNCDNCPATKNAKQIDSDGDFRGDACESGILALDTDGDHLPEFHRLTQKGLPQRCESATFNPNNFKVTLRDVIEGKKCDSCPDINDSIDDDEDGIQNCNDALAFDKDQDGHDSINGNIGRASGKRDLCPELSHADNSDTDGDGIGNVCDNCPALASSNQTDTDGDGIGDVCDNCPTIANSNQADSNGFLDGSGGGDACEQKIISQTWQYPNRQLVSMFPNGADQKTLLDANDKPFEAQASPDGKSIAYTSVAGALGFQLYILDLKTGHNKRITELVNSELESLPGGQRAWGGWGCMTFTGQPRQSCMSWSADSKEILIDAGVGPGIKKLLMINVLNGLNTVQRASNLFLSNQPGLSNEEPAFAPTGKRIAFVGRENQFKSDLWLMQENGQFVKLTQLNGNLTNPTWSPDGTKIAFSVNPLQTNRGSDPNFHKSFAAYIDISSKQVKIIRAGNPLVTDYTPTWSPDGKRIAFFTRDASFQHNSSRSLSYYELSSGNLVELFGFTTQPQNRKVLALKWVSNSYISYISDEQPAGHARVWLLNIHNRQGTLSTNGPAQNFTLQRLNRF